MVSLSLGVREESSRSQSPAYSDQNERVAPAGLVNTAFTGVSSGGLNRAGPSFLGSASWGGRVGAGGAAWVEGAGMLGGGFPPGPVLPFGVTLGWVKGETGVGKEVACGMGTGTRICWFGPAKTRRTNSAASAKYWTLGPVVRHSSPIRNGIPSRSRRLARSATMKPSVF